MDIAGFLDAMETWGPYIPDGYPITDSFHNPWVVIDPISGATAYSVWNDRLKRTDSEEELRAELAKLTGTQKRDEVNAQETQSFWDIFA